MCGRGGNGSVGACGVEWVGGSWGGLCVQVQSLNPHSEAMGSLQGAASVFWIIHPGGCEDSGRER